MATTSLSALSLHDALPIFRRLERLGLFEAVPEPAAEALPPKQLLVSAHLHAGGRRRVVGEFVGIHVDQLHDPVRIGAGDRKSTRLNSSHLVISYAVFCLKK